MLWYVCLEQNNPNRSGPPLWAILFMLHNSQAARWSRSRLIRAGSTPQRHDLSRIKPTRCTKGGGVPLSPPQDDFHDPTASGSAGAGGLWGTVRKNEGRGTTGELERRLYDHGWKEQNTSTEANWAAMATAHKCPI